MGLEFFGLKVVGVLVAACLLGDSNLLTKVP